MLRFKHTLSVLTKDFKSNYLSLSARNLLRDRNEPNTILQQIDITEVTRQLREPLEIKNKSEQTIAISDVHRTEIKEYLDLLDITVDIDTVYLPDLNKKEKRTVITQPGMRYAQAEDVMICIASSACFIAKFSK